MNMRAWRGALSVGGIYGSFLIFAQFAYVELLRADGIGPAAEKLLLGAMAVAGIGSGFLMAARDPQPRHVRVAMLLAAVACAVAPFTHGLAPQFLIAVLTGAALGAATVGLAAWLPTFGGVLWVGVGTGIGYAACNLPVVFEQSPSYQAWIGALFSLVAAVAVPNATGIPVSKPSAPGQLFPAWAAILIFTALVCLDSAAFFIIQHTPMLKAETWGAEWLWRNAALHLLGAVAAGIWLARGGARLLVVISWAILATAAVTVDHAGIWPLGSWLYPMGVSLYATALVAWPGWYSGATSPQVAAGRAAWLFGIAGWIGSANGIGMAQSLHRVPHSFVAISGLMVLAAWWAGRRWQWRSLFVIAGMLLVALSIPRAASPSALLPTHPGRAVYVAEGCIHCHSQYVRPGSPEETIWGPASDPAETLQGKPVLIGNRRHGPDLARIGIRRSPAWLKAHFLNPQSLVPGSRMPTYAHLFDSERGPALVDYLMSNGAARLAERQTQIIAWQPAPQAIPLSPAQGATLFARHCAVCHGENGAGDGPMAATFAKPPPNLARGPWVWTANANQTRLAQIIKFGLPGTDMPGNETLSDADVLALRKHVLAWRNPFP